MAVTTLYAGYLMITTNYMPKGLYLLTIMAATVMLLIIIVLASALQRWYELLQIKQMVKDKYGDPVLQVVEE
jgi:carbon starvation protein